MLNPTGPLGKRIIQNQNPNNLPQNVLDAIEEGVRKNTCFYCGKVHLRFLYPESHRNDLKVYLP